MDSDAAAGGPSARSCASSHTSENGNEEASPVYSESLQLFAQFSSTPCVVGSIDTSKVYTQEPVPPNQPLEVQHSVGYACSCPMPSATSWRCTHGNIVVPAAIPEMAIVGEAGCSVRLQWPTVVHASAYVVELIDQGTMASQRYLHVSPGGVLPTVTDVQVDGLQPSVYAASVRCVAPCGCESACSPWSFSRLGSG